MSTLESALRTLQRVVLGVLLAFLGLQSYGVAVRALPDGRYALTFAAAAAAAVAVALVAALFAEGWRAGRRQAA
ncbi:hypothetical protein [Halobacterium jilantaiense]|uniref:hypothetical protein n=1 Tax=Halobacterium jilantaiense TaxID=355548 RepID=UPI00115FD49D|nr:hypothetical protein [Halobacterium jilantaiense]